MVERCFLDRINGQRTRLSVDFAGQYAMMVASATTTARLAVGDAAAMWTKLALYGSIIQSLVIPALKHLLLKSEYNRFVDV